MFLDVYGISVSIHGDGEALRALAIHFVTFVRNEARSPDIVVDLRRAFEARLPKG